MRFRDRRKALMAGIAMALVVSLPGMALAHDDKDAGGDEAAATEVTTPEEPTTPVLSTLPVLGSGLNVTITRDDDGDISEVALDPADGANIVKEKDHKVVFLLSDGSTEVVVRAHERFVQTKVNADATEDVTGPGSWSADVFGNGAVTIPYTIAFDGNTPLITIGEVVTPEGVTAEVGEPRTHASDDGDSAFSKVKVRLESGDESAKVSFVAKTRVNDEGETRVHLSVTVSSHDHGKWWDDDHDRDKWDRDDDHDRRRDSWGDDSDGERRWDRDDGDRGGDRWGEDHDDDHHERDSGENEDGDGEGGNDEDGN